ncbi:MAG: S8 family peptidase [Desulfomonilaceae bacterium]
MTEYPIILLPKPAAVKRLSTGLPILKPHTPSADRQKHRLFPKFQELAKAFEQRVFELREDPSGAEPEMVLVMETAVDFGEFQKAVRKIEGLEWITEREETEILPDRDFYDKKHPDKKLRGRCYLVMSNLKGQEQLLSLWKKFSEDPNNPSIEYHLRKWKKVFKLLKEIRPWGPKDRLEDTGLVEEWKTRVQEGQDRIKIEVELWYRNDKTRREQAEKSVTGMIASAGGKVICSSTIEEILYHALLAELPIRTVEEVVHLKETHLVRCDEIMFFRPQGQAAIALPRDEPHKELKPPGDESLPHGDPVVALLDGLPLENHTLLAGRLMVDDPDDWASEYRAEERNHGTAMASLILHDELDLNALPLRRPVYVRPIMRPDPTHFQRPAPEAMPREELHVDLVYRAVRRLFEYDGSEPPVAPAVKIINLSICDAWRPFHQLLSPWAKLLDYLSDKYRVLFVVSIGNHVENLALKSPDGANIAEVLSDPDALVRETMGHLLSDALGRRLLSPSEAVNIVTVGATHCDFSTASSVERLIDPLNLSSLPSPLNKQGPGFKRAVKPEVLYRGGRQLYHEPLKSAASTASLRISEVTRPPGQKVAAPGPEGILNATRHIRGTSNATALVTRNAALVYELLNELNDQPGAEQLEDQWASVIIKTILVHSAGWREAQETVRRLIAAGNVVNGISEKAALARLLGYGSIDTERLFRSTDHRTMLLGFQYLQKDHAHVYSLPIPSGLNGVRGWRRVVVTLGWCTPINPRISAYRRARLSFEPYSIVGKEGKKILNDGELETLLNMRRVEADWQAARRGTLQHEMFEGIDASSFPDNSHFQIQVNCAAEGGDKLENLEIPYCLAITVEVAAELNISIYQEIRNRILVPVQPT